VSLELPGRHAPHPFFGVDDDCLSIDGRSLIEIAAQVGRTPFYVYARRYISDRVDQLRGTLPHEMHVHYAVKANPMPAVVAHVVELVDGIDVASGREMQIALDAGAHPSKVSIAGPGKTDAELAKAVAAGITINVESEREIAILGEIGRHSPKRPKLAVRINPDFELKASGMKMGGGPKQFGIDAEQVPGVLAEIGRLPVEFLGFHIFTGSQNLRAEAIMEAQRKSIELATELARFAPSPPKMLNIGGGFGIPYFPGESALDVGPVAEGLHQLVARCKRDLPGTELILELGRYLVGEAGLYVCKVIDRKVSRGQTFLVTDGGLHHHLAASGNFGQVLRKNYPVLIGNRVRGEERELATIVGPLCTPLDMLADRMEMAKASAGDLVVVLQSGAYGLTASPLAFLSHPAPAEVLI